MYMDHKAIQAVIPHRDPFLLLDEVLDLNDDNIHARKILTGQEDFFRGHFPGNPVMPGGLSIEALAQAGAVLALGKEAFRGRTAYFGGMDKVRFKRKVLPGDVLDLYVEITAIRGKIGFGEGRAMVGPAVAATAHLTFAID
jgi:3-hydroxyacyl-[acyl-carrier-protein] dehydratase